MTVNAYSLKLAVCLFKQSHKEARKQFSSWAASKRDFSAGCCAQTSAEEKDFCVVPLYQHSQEGTVIKATCKSFRLPTAPLMDLQPPGVRLSSAISSINTCIWFSIVCVDPYLFFWDTLGLLFSLCLIRKPNQTCSFHCRSLQIEFSGAAGPH